MQRREQRIAVGAVAVIVQCDHAGGRGIELQVPGFDQGVLGDHRRAAHPVEQLAHVARPGVGAQALTGRRTEAACLHRVVAAVPLEQLLLETDAPDQPDSGHRGQRNEPARLTRVCDVVAGLRGMSPGDLAEATTRNACRLFGLPQ